MQRIIFCNYSERQQYAKTDCASLLAKDWVSVQYPHRYARKPMKIATAMGLALVIFTFSYGQRSKCAVLF